MVPDDELSAGTLGGVSRLGELAPEFGPEFGCDDGFADERLDPSSSAC